MAYGELEHFGPLQEDYRAGSMTAMVFNANRNSGAKAKSAADFMPALAAHLEPDEDEIDVDSMSPETRAMALDALFGF